MMPHLSLHNKTAMQGFSLIEVLVAVIIIGILATLSLPALQSYRRNTRLQEARAKLLLDAAYMERHYAQHKTFKKTSTQWPTLPVTETAYFNLSFANVARGALPDTYRIQAVAKDTRAEPRYLLINQDQVINLCENNRCSNY